MVAIVTGQGLGLGGSSLALGQRGQLGTARMGQAGGEAYINAANGNLVLHGRDHWLAGAGHDAQLLRAYNSQGQVPGQWRAGDARRVEGLSGGLNAVGSTVTRVDWDGSAVVYRYDGARGRYVAEAGAGVRATLAWAAATEQWHWDDGTGAVREHYAGSGEGRLLERVDRAGNAVRFTYNGAGQLSGVTTASGEQTQLEYVSGRLSQVRTAYADGSSATAVRYSYDGQGRLSAVTLDLSPGDHSIADGQVYTTWYTYDGGSERVASVRSSDGGHLAFAYLEQGGVHRVAQVMQTATSGEVRTTAFAYDLAAGRTTVTDALGGTTVLSYDGRGRLLRQEGPSVGGTRAVQSFTYDGQGQVASVTDALGHQVRFAYDAAGNLVRQEDDRGTVLERVFDAGNRLQSQTLSGPGTAPAVTRYVYDAAGQLRFEISAQGNVTETRYDAAGQATSTLRYTQDRYSGASADEAALIAWSAGAVRGLERTDRGYDFRGHLAWTRQYTRIAADGSGVVDADTVETRYVYDAQGRLLQRQEGVNGTQAASEHFVYDGLGRLLLATGFSGAQTHYAYDDAGQAVVITHANGLVRTQWFNAARELVGLSESQAGGELSQVRYHYDAGGRLRMTVDATGGRTHTLYDAAGRPVATVDASGALVESVFDGNGQVVQTIAYSTPIAAATRAGWVDGEGRPLAIELAAVRPAANGEDRRSWRFFDAAGQLIKTVAADGTVVDYEYDAGGRLVRRVQNQQRLSVYAFAQDPTLAKATIHDYSAYHTRYFYDGDGRRVGELSATGHLTEWFYDAAGRQTRTVRYANWCASANGTQELAAIYRGAGPQTIVTHTRYDGAGRVAVEVDGEGYLTQYHYDARGQRVRQVQGARVDPGQLTTQTLSGTVVARATGAGAQLAIRVNGVTVETVTLEAGSRSYGFSLTVPVAVDQQVELVALNAGGGRAVVIESAAFAGRAFDRDGLWWTPDAGTAQAVAGGAQTLTEAGTLAWRVDALTLLLERATVPGLVQTTEYAYDVAGRLLRETQRTAGGDTHSEFGYDVMGRLVARTRGERSQLSRYDAQGRVVAELGGEGAAALAALGPAPEAAAVEAVWAQWGVQIGYDAAGQRVWQADALGRRTLFYYDSVGRLSHQVNAAGEVVEYRYTVFGDLAQTLSYGQRVSALSLGGLVGGEVTAAVATLFAGLHDASTRIERRSYTVTGAVAQALDALGYASTYMYNSLDARPTNRYQELVHGDGGARLTRQLFTAWGELAQVTRGAGTTAWHYDAFGRLIHRSDGGVPGYYPSGVETYQGFDRNGRLVERFYAWAGPKERWSYDAFGQVLSQTDATGRTTTYQVDAFGREVRMTTPEGVQTVTKHNAHGQVIEVVDGRGGTLRHEYDRDGRLVRSTDAAGQQTRQAYDRAGQLVEVIDARGMRTVFTYDAAGRVLTRTVDADGLALTTTYVFDAFGQAVEVIDPAGTVTRTTFDAKGQAVEVIHDAGVGRLNLTTTYVFDGAGQVLRVTEGAGTAAAKVTAYEYDVHTGTRTATIVDPDGLALTTHYGYDSRDQVITRTDALGRTTYYAYDGRGQLAYTVAADGSVTGHQYDAAGRMIASTQYARRIDLSGIAAAWAMPASSQAPNAAWVAARLTLAAGEDRTTRTVFDGDGRPRYQIDALGHVSETTFDGNGNAVRQVRYASAVALAGAPSAAQVASALVASADDRVWQAVYDAANRPVYTVDAAGYVTAQTFDAGGNAVRSTRYALRYGGAVDAAALAAWTATVPAEAEAQRTTQMLYDALGRVVFELDALGAGTHVEYDALGREIARYQHRVAFRAATTAHATAISHAELAAFVAARGPDRQAAPVQGQWQYFDAVGRLRYRVTGSTSHYHGTGTTVTEQRYDAAGQVIETRAFYALNAPWSGEADVGVLEARLAPLAGHARATTYAYDGAGRQVTRTDALGTVTRYEYDGVGQVVAEHAAYGTPEVRITRNVYDSEGRLIAQTRAADTAVAATTEYGYDAFGQQVAMTDPRGHELATADSVWALAQRQAHGFVNETGAALRVADLSAAQQAQLRALYTHTQAFDAAGNAVRSVDALGATVERTFDAFGNAVRVLDARGFAGTFFFDARDRVVAQIDPAGFVTVTDYSLDDRVTTVNRYLQRYGGDPGQDPRGQVGGPVATTVMRYDALGRLVESIDAQGGRETWAYGWVTHGPHRSQVTYTNKLGGVVTREYDASGRLVNERGPVMAGGVLAESQFVYNGFGELVSKKETIANYSIRYTMYEYDAGGRLVRINHPSPLGAETRSYDRAGNLTAIVDGRGHRSAFYYDAADRQVGRVDATGALTTNQYDAAGHAIAVRRYDTAVALPAGASLPAGSGAYRETLSQVDALGRVTQTRVVGVLSGRRENDGVYRTRTADLVQSWEYDAGGLLVAHTDGNGHTTRTFFDAMGQALLRVDAAGYAVSWERDAEGNAVREIAYAQGCGDAVSADSDPRALIAGWPRSPADRVTERTFDLNGRVLTETRRHVTYGAVDATNGRLTEQVGDATTAFAWDAAGNLVAKTDAEGYTHRWEYDLGGRMTAQVGPGFHYGGSWVYRRTEYEYNGLNQIVRETRYGGGLGNQVETYEYNTAGQQTAKINALGHRTTFAYDAAGNLSRMGWIRSSSGASGIAPKEEYTDYTYDAANREVRRVTVSAGQAGVAQRTRYNVFGEMTGRGTGEVGWQVYAEYDHAGRMVKGNADRGITRAYIYDAAGNQTMQLESQATDLRPLTLDQIQARAQAQGDVFQTISVYDARNQLIDVIQPEMDSSGKRLGLVSTPVYTLGGGRMGVDVGGRLGHPAQWPTLSTDPMRGAIGLAGASGNIGFTVQGGISLKPGGVTVGNLDATIDIQVPDLSAILGQYDLKVVANSQFGLNFATAEGYAGAGHNGTVTVRLQGEEHAPFTSREPYWHIGAFLYVYAVNRQTQEEILLSELDGMFSQYHQWAFSGSGATFSIYQQSSAPMVLPSNLKGLVLPSDAFRSDANPQVYVRPAGSQGPYQSLLIQRSQSDNRAWCDISALADGPYEVLFVSTEVDDNRDLLRREQYELVVGGQPSIARVERFTGPAVAISGAGQAVMTDATLDLIHLRTRQQSHPTSMVLQYRRPGTQAWTTAALEGLPPLHPAGSGRWALAGLSGDFEIQVLLHDGDGQLLDTVKGAVTVGSAVTLDFEHEPDQITLTHLPPNATEVEFVLLRPDGSVAAALPAQALDGTGRTVLAIPPSVLAEVGQGVATYALVATLHDRNMVPPTAYTARGNVQIGPHRPDGGAVLNTDQHLYTVNLDPSVHAAQVVNLYYRPDGDVHAPFARVTLLRDRDGKFSWDSLGLDPARTYEYFYDVFGSLEEAQGGDSSLSLARNSGYFWPEQQQAHERQWEYQNIGASSQTIHRQQGYNAFGEVVTEIDGNGNVVTLAYNTRGDLTRKTDPLVWITHGNGFREQVRPLTSFVYDRLGNLVGHRDANGNLTTQVWNYGTASAAVEAVWQPDGGVKRYNYNVLGHLVDTVDELGRRTHYNYDGGNRLILIERPRLADGSAYESYYYDELGQRVQSGTALGWTFTDYDSDGNVTRTQSGADRVKTYQQYWVANGDDGHWVKVMTDANGRSSTDTVDAHGRLLTRVDLGGHTFTYEYNHAGLLARSGQTVYEYYGNGMLLRMRDEESRIEGYYEYDKNGNRTFEGFTGKDGNWAFQQSNGTYDALNRLVRVWDQRYAIEYEFDAVGNRIRVHSQYNDALGGAESVQDYWYQYDAMNRFTVTMGQLYNGRRGDHGGDTSAYVWRGASGDGVSLSYDQAGQRRTATHASDGHTEVYHYDANGQLTDTYINGVLRARRINDRYGRVIEYNEYKADGAHSKSISHTWDADHLLLRDHDNLKKSGTTTHRYADGTIHYTQTYTSDPDVSTVKTTYSYVWFDSAKQVEIHVQASHESAKNWAPGFSKFVYDSRGRLKLAYDTAGQRGFHYQSDGEGRILQRDEMIGGKVDASGNVSNAQQNRFHSYYLFGDRQVGNIGNDGIDRIDYAKELAQSEAAVAKQGDGRHKRFTPVAGADFDVNYQPINSLYPSAAPGTFVIREGDTLQTIAAALWGDASLWYILAEANGLTLQQKLIPNTTITVPNKVTNIHNNASTFKPYDAGQAIGNVNPTIPDPPPPPNADKGCGGFVKVLAIVVAVVVTIYTAGVASGAGWGFASAMSAGTTAGAGAMAAGAAVGSVASQGVMMAGGQQDQFSWKQVALSAAGGAISGGVASGLGSGVGGAMARGAVANAGTQGVAVAIGAQDRFDWKGIAASAIASGVGYGFDTHVVDGLSKAGWNQGSIDFARGMAVGASSAAARGNLSSESLTMIGLDVLGSTIGSRIASNAAARSAVASSMPGAMAMGGVKSGSRSYASGHLPAREATEIGPSLGGLGSHKVLEGTGSQPDEWLLDTVTVTADKAPSTAGIDYFMQQLVTDGQLYRPEATPAWSQVQAPSAEAIAHYQRTGRAMPSMSAYDPTARQQLAQAIAVGGANPLAGAAGAVSSALGGSSADINRAMVRTDAMTGPLLDIATGGSGARVASARGGRTRPIPLSGETRATASGNSIHAELAAERRTSAAFDLVPNAQKPFGVFPDSPSHLTEVLGVGPKKISLTPDGTQRVVWEPNVNTRIRYESHPEGLRPGEAGFNARHHGEHYHVEIKPDGVSWNQANKQGLIIKVKPENYTPGSGTGFLPGERFPGQ